MRVVRPLPEASVTRFAELYAELRRQGQPLDDMDLLIAGIALAHDWVLATYNQNHFARIQPLIVEDWSEPLAERIKPGPSPERTRPAKLASSNMPKTSAGQLCPAPQLNRVASLVLKRYPQLRLDTQYSRQR